MGAGIITPFASYKSTLGLYSWRTDIMLTTKTQKRNNLLTVGRRWHAMHYDVLLNVKSHWTFSCQQRCCSSCCCCCHSYPQVVYDDIARDCCALQQRIKLTERAMWPNTRTSEQIRWWPQHRPKPCPRGRPVCYPIQHAASAIRIAQLP